MTDRERIEALEAEIKLMRGMPSPPAIHVRCDQCDRIHAAVGVTEQQGDYWGPSLFEVKFVLTEEAIRRARTLDTFIEAMTRQAKQMLLSERIRLEQEEKH